MGSAYLRFYEELNDFLPADRRQTRFSHRFKGKPSVKDLIESVGVPHTEVDLVIVNGRSVSFAYQVADRDDISVYPVFELLDISPVTRLRGKPLRQTRFILDVHLGKLARTLRMFGMDTAYRNNYKDEEIVCLAKEEKRIILTRDLGILKRSEVTHGYWVRNYDPEKQILEIISYFNLQTQLQELTRCLECNALIKAVDKEKVITELPEKVREHLDEFYQCRRCRQVYWKGSHYDHMHNTIKRIKDQIKHRTA